MKYFVGRNAADQIYRCRVAGDKLWLDTIWQGDDYYEGQKVAKEANAKLRPPPQPKAPVISPEERERIKQELIEFNRAKALSLRQEADREKLEKWVKGTK